LLKCCGNCCDSKRDAGLLSVEFVIWVLRIIGVPPANCRSFEYSSLIGLPNVLSPAKSNPQVSVIDLDEFDRSMYVFGEVNVIPGVGVSLSLIFKVCVNFDMCWEIVLLSSKDLQVLVVKSSI